MRELIGDYETFIADISDRLPELGIERSEIAMMDHLCYRVESEERYEILKDAFSDQAAFLGEAVIGGRNIATFELDEYLQASNWVVPYLELPAPKQSSPYPEGLEHAELVVVGSLERFIDRHRNLEFEYKGMGKEINPELGLKTVGISIKFHEQSLGAVVRIEDSLT